MRIILLLLILASALFSSSNIYSDSTFAVVIGSTSTAIRTGRDMSIKSTVKAGDVITQGDRIDVPAGGMVQVAFDRDAQNVLRIEPGTSVTFEKLGPVSIDISKGKIYAFLDNKARVGEFKVLTSSSIARAYGTHFQVQSNDAVSQVLTYEGRVHVAGRDEHGKQTLDFVILSPNEKTRITSIHEAPNAAEDLNPTEIQEAGKIQTDIQRSRTRVKAEGLIEKAITATPSTATSTPAKPAEPKTKGELLF